MRFFNFKAVQEGSSLKSASSTFQIRKQNVNYVANVINKLEKQKVC